MTDRTIAMFADKGDTRPRKVSGSQWSQWSKKYTILALVDKYGYLCGKLEVMQSSKLLTLNSNYKRLLSYQKTVVIYDLTYYFCNRFVDKHDRTFDQMIQAARSGKQNIVEGYVDMATSKEMGIKLFNVARASLMELAEDYADYLRVRGLRRWDNDSKEMAVMTQLGATHSDSQYFLEMAESRSDEIIANMALVLIRQAQSLICKYVDRVSVNFASEGGFREQMTVIRLKSRKM